MAGIVNADSKYLFPHVDLISHFVLRMAYCRTEELWRWLLTNESQLFGIWLAHARPSEIAAFLDENDIKFAAVSVGVSLSKTYYLNFNYLLCHYSSFR